MLKMTATKFRLAVLSKKQAKQLQRKYSNNDLKDQLEKQIENEQSIFLPSNVQTIHFLVQFHMIAPKLHLLAFAYATMSLGHEQ